jgi:nitroreductase
VVDFPAALAEIPVAEWASAVSVRRSARTYTERRVEQASLDALRAFSAGLPGRSVARVAVLGDAPQELFTGLVLGSYGRVVGAQSAVLVIGRPAERVFQESMGYLGEALLLQATTMGLGTCWIAGSFDRAVASRSVGLEEGEQVFAASPLGYAQEKPRTGELLMKALVRAKHRRSATEIAPGFDEEHWPAWAAEGVRLARIAPSAVNRQPWRFKLDQGAVTVSVVRRGAEGSVSRLLDVGIAMLHFEVGARLMGALGTWEVLGSPDVALFRPDPR